MFGLKCEPCDDTGKVGDENCCMCMGLGQGLHLLIKQTRGRDKGGIQSPPYTFEMRSHLFRGWKGTVIAQFDPLEPEPWSIWKEGDQGTRGRGMNLIDSYGRLAVLCGHIREWIPLSERPNAKKLFFVNRHDTRLHVTGYENHVQIGYARFYKNIEGRILISVPDDILGRGFRADPDNEACLAYARLQPWWPDLEKWIESGGG